MNEKNTLPLEQVARQFEVEALAPRTEIWSRDIEREAPSVPCSW
jgi:hypothetical protein